MTKPRTLPPSSPRMRRRLALALVVVAGVALAVAFALPFGRAPTATSDPTGATDAPLARDDEPTPTVHVPRNVDTRHANTTRTILVRDANGAPIPDLTILAARATPHDAPTQRLVRTVTAGRTDADGTYWIADPAHLATNVDEHLPQHTNRATPGPTPNTTFDLVPRLLGLDDARLSIDANAPASSPIVWTLPPTGSVEIVAHLPPGAVAETIAIARTDNPPTAHTFAELRRDRSLRPPLPAVLRHVGLGIRVSATAVVVSGPARIRETWECEAAGPTSAGEAVRLELRRPDLSYVRGRLVDAAHRPAMGARAWLMADAPNGQESILDSPLTDGHFAFAVAPGMRGREVPRATLVVHTNDRDPSEIAEAELGALTLPDSGDRDLGDVLALALPIAAAGVVHVDGTPSGDQPVHLAVFDPNERGFVDWQRQVSAADGTFTFFGRDRRQRLQLWTEVTGAIAAPPIECAFGTSGLVLERRRGAAVRIEILLPPLRAPLGPVELGKDAGPRPTVDLVALPPTPARDDASAGPPTLTNTRTHVTAAWLARGLQPGQYRVDVRTPLFREPLHSEVVDLRLPATDAHDAKVVPLDFRDRLRVVELGIEFEDGKRPSDLRLTIESADTTWEVRLPAVHRRLLLPAEGPDVSIHAPFDRQSLHFRKLRENVVARFRAIPMRRVGLTTPADLTTPRSVRRTVFVEDVRTARRHDPIPTQGTVTQLTLPADTNYRVGIELRSKRGSVTLRPHPPEFELRPGTDALSITLDVDRAAFARAATELATEGR